MTKSQPSVPYLRLHELLCQPGASNWRLAKAAPAVALGYPRQFNLRPFSQGGEYPCRAKASEDAGEYVVNTGPGNVHELVPKVRASRTRDYAGSPAGFLGLERQEDKDLVVTFELTLLPRIVKQAKKFD